MRRVTRLRYLAFCFFGAAAVASLPASLPAAERHRGIEIVDAWIRPPNKSSPDTLAFFTIVNHTDHSEQLVGVVSPGGQGSLSLFHPGLEPYVEKLKSIDIAAGAVIKLRPGQFFVILKDAGEQIRPGRTLAISLHFQSAGSLDMNVPVTNQLLGNMARPKSSDP